MNITFTYAFADYYLRSLTPLEQTHLNALASCPSVGVNTALTPYTFPETDLGLRGVRNRVVSGSLGGGVTTNPSTTNFIALLADMSSEVIRYNATLKELGIMQVSYAQSYEYMNKYLNIIRGGSADVPTALLVFSDMETKLKHYTNMIGLIYYHIRSNTYRLNVNKVLPNFTSASPIATVAALQAQLTATDGNLTPVIIGLQAQLSTSTDSTKTHTLINELRGLQDVKTYLQKANAYYSGHVILNTAGANPEELIINSDIVYTLYADIIPKLKSAGIWNAAAANEIPGLENICRYIQQFYLADATNELSIRATRLATPARSPLGQFDIEKFLTILSTAYQFDRANTFSTSVKMLSDLEELFPNERIKDALSFINSYVRDFVAISKKPNGNEYIELNVESLISKLSAVKSDRLRRGSIVFNVGVNSVYFNKPLTLESSETIRSFSFVSEKIGFKYKIIDRYFWQTRNPGETYTIDGMLFKKKTTPREPAISDFHYILYGSGILYNIVNTGTSSNFNYPIIGNGLGLTFYNSLEMNITYGMPILKNGTFSESADYSFWGLSFDFPFAEYIKRLGEKQRDKTNKKLIAESSN